MNGRKRHIAVDAMGLLLAVVITAASVQDRDAARPLLWNLHRTNRRIRLIWADAVYTGKLSTWAAAMKMTLQIVPRRNPHAFEVLPRRWVVERTFAWISKHRRTVRDYERLPASHEAMILWAMIALMACRLTQPSHLSNTHLGIRGPYRAGRGGELSPAWTAHGSRSTPACRICRYAGWSGPAGGQSARPDVSPVADNGRGERALRSPERAGGGLRRARPRYTAT